MYIIYTQTYVQLYMIYIKYNINTNNLFASVSFFLAVVVNMWLWYVFIEFSFLC